MRSYLTILALLTLISCGDRPTSTQAPTVDTTTVTARTDVTKAATYCFQQVTGRDSIMARLVVNGADVTGELTVLLDGKDQARGLIRGRLTGNQIRSDWQRSGEGVTQPHEVTFTMTGDRLSWYEGERVEKQGKWVLKNPNGGFQYVLTKTDCP